jgi:hypothetical protein
MCLTVGRHEGAVDLVAVMESKGETRVLVGGGVSVGFLLGAVAQQSRFCLCSAVIEFRRRQPGTKLAV